MNKSKLPLYIILGLVTLGVIIYIATGAGLKNDDDTNGNNNGVPPIQDNMIRVSEPDPNEIVTSPLTVEGVARGNWYFEATFPLKIITEDGQLLATSYAQAEGEWMTTEFVPFKGTITFSFAATSTIPEKGFVIFEKDNPSGLPEHFDERRVPVRFK